MNVLVIPSWYPNGSIDKLMGIYHKEYCEALAKCDNINVNMLYIDRQRLNAPFKYLFMIIFLSLVPQRHLPPQIP